MNAKAILIKILERKEANIHYFPSGKEFTVGQLCVDVERFSAQIKSANSIFLSAPNCYEWLVVYFACIFSEKTLFTADFQLGDAEINRRIFVCKPDIVIVSGDRVLQQEYIAISDIMKYHFEKIDANQNEFEGFRFIQFTSGTTGSAKGVVMQYNHIVPHMIGMQELCKFQPNDRFLLASPMSHPMGHIFMLLTLAYSERLIMTESPMFLPQAIMTSNASIMVTPPVMLSSLKAHPDMVKKLTEFRYLLCAGAPLDDNAYAFYRTAGVRILNGYGMTECVSGIAMGEPDSTGRLIPLSCCEITIADDGEILVRGESVCDRYLNGDSISNNGWYHTKDLGKFDLDGRLLVTGRKDNLVVLQNGFKIALEPMEAKINSTDGVLDCVVRVLREDGRDIIECDLVPDSNTAWSVEKFKQNINQNLDFHEKVERLNLCEKLTLRGGKKERKK